MTLEVIRKFVEIFKLGGFIIFILRPIKTELCHFKNIPDILPWIWKFPIYGKKKYGKLTKLFLRTKYVLDEKQAL